MIRIKSLKPIPLFKKIQGKLFQATDLIVEGGGQGHIVLNYELRIKEGRVEVPALFANEITNLCGHEEIIRLIYPSFSLKQRYGITINLAP